MSASQFFKCFAKDLIMLYKFKSKVTGDVIMLEASGRRLLELIGKAPDAKGIIVPDQMPMAIGTLEAAILSEEAVGKRGGANGAGDVAEGEAQDSSKSDGISLRQRATPFIAMLKKCHGAKADVVWGV
jgi:Domain of unknown function (DUF1840)